MKEISIIDYAEFVSAKIQEDHRIGNDVHLMDEREIKSVEGYKFTAIRTTFIEVIDGKGSISIDGRTYDVDGHCVIGYFSGQTIVKNIDVVIQRGMMLSDSFMESLYLGATKYHSIRSAVITHPVFRVNGLLEESLDIYAKAMINIASREFNPYNLLSAKYLTLSLFYSPLNEMFRSANPEEGSTRSREITETFLSLLEEYYKNRYDINFYADKLNISLPYLYASVVATTGKSPKQWMNLTLMSEAKKLLEDPDLSVLQISQILNFSSLQSFGKFFHNNSGMSPRSFRTAFFEKNAVPGIQTDSD